MELPPEKRKNALKLLKEKEDGDNSDEDAKDEKSKNPDLEAVKSEKGGVETKTASASKKKEADSPKLKKKEESSDDDMDSTKSPGRKKNRKKKKKDESKPDSEYNLYLQDDTNADSALFQWYYFSVMNIKADTLIRINICNLSKPNGLYAKGMKPFVYSTNK